MTPTVVRGLAALPGPHLPRRAFHGVDVVTHLLETAAAYPGPLVAHAAESLFAPHMGTVACIGARGRDAVRAVLTNADDYISLRPDVDDLPDDVRRMSDSVFSAGGGVHADHRAAVRQVLRMDPSSAETIRMAAASALGRWAGRQLHLVAACRSAAYEIWSAVLFGPGDDAHRIGAGVRAVVDARRAKRMAATPADRQQARRQAVHASRDLMTSLGAWLGAPERDGILAPLGGRAGGEDERLAAIAQATALCAASTEPFAASLAWTVLVLTQRHDLQDAVRDELDQGAHAAPGSPRPRALLERVVLETQRLLPSSAMVTRATVRPVVLAGAELPARCEIVVSSLVAHRDAERFESPATFRPERWDDLDVTPFEFFPFGAGVRACLGASVARAALDATLRRLVADTTVRLPFDVDIGWRMPDALTPSSGVPLVVDNKRPSSRPGRALGPIRQLVDFVVPGA